MWSTPAAGLPYEPLFLEASAAYGLPDGLLSRVAYAESRYNPDAYNSSSGASGIMQIIPRFHPSVDPWNPAEAIPYGAAYLRENYNRFGTWELALAAYNAGPGNVERYGGVPPFPETMAYVASILEDVSVAAPAAPAQAGIAAAGAVLLLLLMRGKHGR